MDEVLERPMFGAKRRHGDPWGAGQNRLIRTGEGLRPGVVEVGGPVWGGSPRQVVSGAFRRTLPLWCSRCSQRSSTCTSARWGGHGGLSESHWPSLGGLHL